jgi:hypothetical protein
MADPRVPRQLPRRPQPRLGETAPRQTSALQTGTEDGAATGKADGPVARPSPTARTGVACERRLKNQETLPRSRQRRGQSIRARRPIAAT